MAYIIAFQLRPICYQLLKELIWKISDTVCYSPSCWNSLNNYPVLLLTPFQTPIKMLVKQADRCFCTSETKDHAHFGETSHLLCNSDSNLSPSSTWSSIWSSTPTETGGVVDKMSASLVLIYGLCFLSGQYNCLFASLLHTLHPRALLEWCHQTCPLFCIPDTSSGHWCDWSKGWVWV